MSLRVNFRCDVTVPMPDVSYSDSEFSHSFDDAQVCSVETRPPPISDSIASIYKTNVMMGRLPRVSARIRPVPFA